MGHLVAWSALLGVDDEIIRANLTPRSSLEVRFLFVRPSVKPSFSVNVLKSWGSQQSSVVAGPPLELPVRQGCNPHPTKVHVS